MKDEVGERHTSSRSDSLEKTDWQPHCDVAVGPPILAVEKVAVTRDRSTACSPPADLQECSRLQTTEEEDEA